MYSLQEKLVDSGLTDLERTNMIKRAEDIGRLSLVQDKINRLEDQRKLDYLNEIMIEDAIINDVIKKNKDCPSVLTPRVAPIYHPD